VVCQGHHLRIPASDLGITLPNPFVDLYKSVLDRSRLGVVTEELFELVIRELAAEPDPSPELNRNKDPYKKNEQNQQF
jgi:hypothetical protein